MVIPGVIRVLFSALPTQMFVGLRSQT